MIPNCEDACPPDASATRAARAGTLPTRDLWGRREITATDTGSRRRRRPARPGRYWYSRSYRWSESMRSIVAAATVRRSQCQSSL